MHYAERNHLMKNKNKFTFLALTLLLGLTVGACTPNVDSSNGDLSSEVPTSSINNSSSDAPSAPASSNVASSSKSTYTVNFVVGEQIIKTYEVNPGEIVEYDGEEPSKNPDDNAVKYRFKSWDKDISQPITSDTTFNAVFAEYASEILVDDFEKYSGAGSLKDAGWAAWTLGSDGATWTKETKAAVSVSRNAADGNKALRLDAWQNDCDFKACKALKKPFDKVANAIQFKLMIPSEMKSVKVLLVGEIEIQGTLQRPSFQYVITPTSSEYMEYTIPLADDDWLLWGKKGDSIKAVADWMGIHQDDYLNYLTSIEFYARGKNEKNSDYLAFIDSVKFVTLDNASFEQTQKLKKYDRYTGTLADGHILKVDLADNGSATAKIIDLEVPQTIEGSYVIANDEITFTSSDNGTSLVYKGDITNAGKLIKFKSATGNFANSVSEMNLDAVQVVNNFEQYTESGVAFSQKHLDTDDLSGLRGDFYSEYYVGTGWAEWGKDGWQQMPEGDEINLIKDSSTAHGGNNYASFKHFKENGARYMPWDLYAGNGDKNAFRGSTLGLWVKGYVDRLTISMYFQPKPTATSRDTYVKRNSFSIGPSIEEWTHIEVELDPKYIYYGFILLTDNDYSNGDSALLVDDIEVYGASPYTVYKEPEVKKLTQNMSYIGKINDLVKVQLLIKDETQVSLTIPGLESAPLEGTYVYDGAEEVTMTFDNDVYVASVSEDMKTFAFKSISGTGKAATYLNNLSFNMIDYADNAETYDGDGQMYYQYNQSFGNLSGARGAYYCQYLYQGSWILMGGNGDQLGLDTVNYIEGKQSLKMKKSTNGDLKYTQWGLFDGTAEPHTGVSKFAIWLRNPLSTATNLQLMLFKVQKVTSSTDIEANKIVKDITLDAYQSWTEYTLNLDPNETYYGYSINAPKASATGYFNVDNAYYYSVDNDPNINFYAPKGLELIAKEAPVSNQSSLVFGENGLVRFYPSLAADTVYVGTYSMEMNDTNQEMTIVLDDNSFTGTYVVSASGAVTFTVQSVEGTLASLIEVGTIFSNL